MENKKQSTYDPSFYDSLFSIEEKHFWFRSRARMINSLVANYLKTGPKHTIMVEIGCGTGMLLNSLKGLKKYGLSLIGMDLFSEGIRLARKRSGIPVIQADMLRPPFDGRVNLIGLFDVLEHIPEDEKALDAIHQMLSTGGRLLVTVPAFPSLWSYFDVAACHARRYTLPEIISKTERAGFRIVSSSYTMSFLFPVLWILRRLNRFFHKSGAPAQDLAENELRIIPVFNEITGWLLAMERWLIFRGVRFPFGSSIILTAEKVDQPENG